jgi:hypothetical protein
MRAFELDHGGTRRAIEMECVLAAAESGAIVVLQRALVESGYLARFTDLYLDEIGAMTSPEVARTLRERGLERMHDVLEPDAVAALIGRLDKRAAVFALPLSRALVEAGSSTPRPHYFICGRTWIRAVIPYRLLENTPLLQTEHLFGHVLPTDLHRDTWVTHPRNTLAFWGAVGPVREGNTLALFEGSEAVPGRALTPSLAPGDVLVFNGDSLHASVRNHTDETRVSIGTRIVRGRRLRFGPGAHWRPWYDASLVDTPLAPLATLQSRLNRAALRRWRARRAWRKQERTPAATPAATPAS